MLHCGGNYGQLENPANSKSMASCACDRAVALDRILDRISIRSKLYSSSGLRFLLHVVVDIAQVSDKDIIISRALLYVVANR